MTALQPSDESSLRLARRKGPLKPSAIAQAGGLSLVICMVDPGSERGARVTADAYASFHRRNVRHNSIVASANMQIPAPPTENKITNSSTSSVPSGQSSLAMFGDFPMRYVTI